MTDEGSHNEVGHEQEEVPPPLFKADFSSCLLVVALTLVCEDVMLPECTPRRDFWLLCGVPFRGETYGRGDDVSDVRETGD